LIVAALFAGTPALAAVQLTPTDVEPNASGRANLSQVKLIGIGTFDLYAGTLSITCKGLKPNAEYSTPVGIFMTSATGILKAEGQITFIKVPDWPTSIWVDVRDDTGQIVLSGSLGYK
jgi:hypothetical protein